LITGTVTKKKKSDYARHWIVDVPGSRFINLEYNFVYLTCCVPIGGLMVHAMNEKQEDDDIIRAEDMGNESIMKEIQNSIDLS